MKKALLISFVIVLSLIVSPGLYAQTTNTARVVAACGNQSFTAGTTSLVTVDTTGVVCTDSGGGPGGSVTIDAGTVTTVGTVNTVTAVTGITNTVTVNADAAAPVLVSALSGGTETALVMSTTGSGLKVDASGYTITVTSTDAGVGNTTDAAAAAGGVGSLNAKARLQTSQLDSIQTSSSSSLTALQAIETAVESTDPVGVTQTGYTVAVGWGSSVNLAVTNTALVTVSAGSRIILHEASVTCNSDVSVAVTVSLGFGAAAIPSTGSGLIIPGLKTSASSFQGIVRGVGWPNVLHSGADGNDLFLTMTAPTGGECGVMITYSTEAV